MRKVLFALLSALVITGCSTTPRGGTSSDSDTAEQVDYGQASVENNVPTDFGRGTDRFSQDSSRMLPGKEPDVRTFRQ
jgi:hypothetical protein